MQKTKKFRRLLAGGVAVLMLGVSVPVAAFATGGDEPGPGYRFVDITFNTFNEDVTFVENGETTLTVTTTDDQTAYAIPAVNCENGYELTGWSTSYGATVTDTVDASQADWDESNYWGTGTMSVTAIIEKVGPVVENKDVVVYFITDDGEALLEQPVNVPVTSDGGVETVALADLENALADYLAQKGYALAEGNNDPQTVTNGSVNLMVNKVSGPVVENKDVVVYFTTDDGETLLEQPVNVPVTSDGGVESVALADLENALADYLTQKGYALAEGNNDPQTVTDGSVYLMVNKVSNTQKNVPMTIRFVLADGTVVTSGEYSLPEGIQNMSILEQYVPAGYKMMESGDFFVTEGGQEDITVEKINETVTVSVAFKNEWGFVVGGGYYIVPAGEQDVSVLAQYVPAGYVLDEEGTINFVDGQHYDISVKSDESIVNIQFIDREGNVIAGGDYFVPTGVQNTAILDELGYTPVGYRQVVHTYVLFMYGHHYVILVEAIPEQVTAKTAVFRKDAAEDVWNENPDNPDEVRYTFYSDDAEATNTVPSITVADETKELDYWVAEMDSSITLQPGEEFCYNDLDQGALKDQIGDLLFIAVYKDVEVVEPTPAPSEEPTPAPSEEPTEPTPAPSEQPTAEPTAAPTAQPETPADNNDDNTTTVTSDNSDDVVKSDTPADNTAKVLPQTGVESSAPVIGFAFVLLAALGGAAAYLFVVRKKLN